MVQYTGTYTARADVKWRLFFPANFRRLVDEQGLAQRYVLKRDVYAPCLVIYPYVAWEQELATLREKINRWHPQQAMLFRRFMSDVVELSLDANGRFAVPKAFQTHFSEDRKVVFLGADDRIEIWSEDRFEAEVKSVDTWADDLEKLMNG